MSGLDPLFPLFARLALALLFVGAVRHKLADLLRFEGIVRDYRLSPAAWSSALARALVVLEIGLVLGLVAPWTASRASVVAAIVLAGYALAIGLNLARGRSEIECGCGGPGERLRLRLVARNALLIGVGLVGATAPAERAFGALDAVTLAGGLASVALLWSAASHLAGVADAALPEEAS
jgi:uncharacterized membrane protein YphA (DoxX/SURF4 family)